MAALTINRQDNQPVYVLHTYPFKETSLVVELFSREFGRVAAVAKGARRPRSAMRGMLQAFQPLQATWSGKAELKNLHSMEWGAGLLLLRGEALMCGFYLNELLLRLLPREDGHDALFDYYSQTLRILAQAQVPAATTLRRFELRMLQELGYAVPLEYDEAGNAIKPEHMYSYVAEQGAAPTSQHVAPPNGVQLSGKTLLAMAQDDYSDALTQQQSKQLMRALLAHYLGDKPLHTRQLLMDLQAL
ncbi:DNA repair protein RecO [Methylobacillus sp.]|uniref:DNA repair protein RecO n=1 Tax=Methylobacillus sp. TaxID=56818 RepID=UPI0012CBF891|nr:DNA repair protein RecO [Methylobacillus sp.]MPS49779.1 DNA repair protein RecO [Methylobacillus sp.]